MIKPISPMVSPKREYLRRRPETFGDFRLKIFKPGVRRQSRRREKPDFRLLCASLAEPGQTQDWLAGDAVMIAPVSGQIPCKQGIFQGILVIPL